MNSKQTNNFFIHSSLSGVSTALLQQNIKTDYYQRLIFNSLTCRVRTFEGVEQLARQIATIARQAHLARRMDAVEQASQLMLALPLSEQMRGVALYYEALCTKRRGDVESARRSLEQVVERATSRYKARALQCIGATYFENGDPNQAVPFYLAAGKASVNCDLATGVESQWMIAVVRSIHGDHRQSLKDLERLFPLVREMGRYYPARYYEFLNSLSVELGEGGRIAEAEAAINIALASPFACAYPEWSETCEEIEQKRNYPDPSRCFLDRSSVESDANRDSITKLSVKADTERATEAKPVRATKLCRFVGQSIYLKPITLPIADKAIIPGGLAQSFLLQCLGRCVQSRAPPTI